ncbi:hypothetical protein CDAR_373361 [Caerostris darwini]|uniref:Uncharacterized protein n=1 Tax=Caerostris darwini TaxID=1538125 RepID=A0AAV4MZF2_9ARAC|nr:hypothetical protein CDAR_373361 [Caerostris darwini]
MFRPLSSCEKSPSIIHSNSTNCPETRSIRYWLVTLIWERTEELNCHRSLNATPQELRREILLRIPPGSQNPPLGITWSQFRCPANRIELFHFTI